MFLAMNGSCFNESMSNSVSPALAIFQIGSAGEAVTAPLSALKTQIRYDIRYCIKTPHFTKKYTLLYISVLMPFFCNLRGIKIIGI